MVAGVLAVALMCLGAALVVARDTRAGAAADGRGGRRLSPEVVSGLVLLSSGLVLAVLRVAYA